MFIFMCPIEVDTWQSTSLPNGQRPIMTSGDQHCTFLQNKGPNL